MSEPLSPLKKKIHPFLGASFRKGLCASVFVFLFGMCWRAHHIEDASIGDPVKRTEEMKDLRAQYETLDAISRDLGSVQELSKNLNETARSASWLQNHMKAPPVKISYDRAWLETIEEQLAKQLKEGSQQAELKLIHSQNLSERDFILLSQEFMKSRGEKHLIHMYDDKLEGDYPMTHVSGMHACQREVAAKLGNAPTDDSAYAIKSCTDEKYDWRRMTVYAGMGGVICLGFYGRRLRKKWDAVAAPEKTVAAAPPVPCTGPVIVTTSQPVTMKPIRITRKALV